MKPEHNHTRIVWIVLTIFILLILLFIWGNSFLPAHVSSAISSFVTKLLGKDAVEAHVRKAGHFTEFFLLGGALGLYVTVMRIKGREKAMLLALLGLFVPLMDETIQMFNDRGPQVRDIWIDIAGYTCGGLLMLLILAVMSGLRRGFLRVGKEKKTDE